ncbi:phosphotransferase [uncultured Pseudokineococcus sp.]|uniref:phosphotransferase n=1 Tax=uncultured Pseudokineococcus sp. TaxID=1642928 RepID=UPI00261F7688|nr:phosphotransferase [uncultured Pseudokineococcus sp.]
MPRSPLVLAALASAAVPGLVLQGTRRAGVEDGVGEDVDAAVVTDASGSEWVVRAPLDAASGLLLDQESSLLRRFSSLGEDVLPFAVPDLVGSASLKGGGRAVIHRRPPGRPLHPGDLRPGPGLSSSLGTALGRLHDLPPSTAEEVGLPAYTAEEHRERRLVELDRAASTGQVPPGLLSRWEKATEDVGRWRFSPCLVHGDLTPERVLAEGRDVVAVVEWGEARVGDPADDLAWVAVGADTDALDTVLEAYAVARHEPPDRHLPVRAQLSGEVALVRWLLHGVRTDDAGVVDDAVQMLRDLDSDVGGEAL